MDFEERMISPDLTSFDSDIETTLRPRVLTDYIGQDKVKENLEIYIKAASSRGTCDRRSCSYVLEGHW